MFKDNSVLIIPSNIKNDVIENIRKDNNLLNISFITREDFIKKVTFDYTNKELYEVSDVSFIKVYRKLKFTPTLLVINKMKNTLVKFGKRMMSR